VRRWLYSLVLLAGLSALAACSSEEKEAPASPPPAATAKAGWEQEWDQVVAAAKREGKVSVLMSAGDDMRKGITQPFEKKYGITVEVLVSGSGVDLGPRLQTERTAGQYLWDVLIHGTSIHLYIIKPLGALDPLEPALILPEVKEGKGWFGGKFPWVDKDRTSATALLGSIGAFYVNPNMVKAEDFKSYKDLLDPKWKGKIAVFDPTIPGAGLAAFTYYYQNKDLGPEFIRALAAQQPTFTRDYQEQLQWLAQGRFPIAVGVHGSIAKVMREAGAPLKAVDPAQMREGGFLASAIGTVGLVNKAPHPNAAKLYVNWLLSKEGQTEMSRGAAYASARVDIPTNHLEPWELPKQGFFLIDTEEGRALENEKVKALVAQVFGQ